MSRKRPESPRATGPVPAVPRTPGTPTPRRRWWASPLAHGVLLAIVCTAVYSNNFRHDFLLDDGHSIERNIAVRSLANIPSYFTDPATFSSLRANIDYRPVLQVTYALNYWMGGYDTFWWHATQILLHLACVLGLYFLCRAVLRQTGGPLADPAMLLWVPLLSALVWAVHPTASGVVNYISARSSMMTAAFLLAAFGAYMRPQDDPRSARVSWPAVVLFALALMTKVEAVAALAVFFLWEVWRTARARGHQHGLMSDLRAALDRQTLRRILPLLAVAAAYFAVRMQVMAPFNFDESRRQPGVTALDYLLTQTVVWWEYVAHWFVPVGLVADHGSYPVYRSIFSGPVPLAILGWLGVAALALASWRKQPWLAFLAISALALLSPTSSIAPLSEMLNEHRPYLPVAVLSLAWMIPLGAAIVRTQRARPALLPAVAVTLVTAVGVLGAATVRRNQAFSTNRAYLEDILAKAPSGRALVNYGLIFMREGDYARARDLFTRALEYSPRWHIVHINLGIVKRQAGELEEARRHFDLAVEYDRFSGTALTWRGEHHLAIKDFAAAVRDFEVARPRSLDHYALCRGLATGHAGLGEVDQAVAQTRECLRLDAAQTGRDIVAISTPFFENPDLAAAGLRYFDTLAEILPGTWWVHANIATLAGRLGDDKRAAAARQLADSLRAGTS